MTTDLTQREMQLLRRAQQAYRCGHHTFQPWWTEKEATALLVEKGLIREEWVIGSANHFSLTEAGRNA